MPPPDLPSALERLRHPSWDRYDLMLWALGAGASMEDLVLATGVDPWFCDQLAGLAAAGRAAARPLESMDAADLRAARRSGLTDRDLAERAGADERAVGRRRRSLGVSPTYHAVDTCAAEFAALTPYYYSAFETEGEAARDDRPALVVLGSGPNRIGQGIEFDYCCVHAAETARELGYASVMINCNPETVSTDHGVSDRLYLEPVTLDAVLDICALERPAGVIAQLGGQTPLRLAAALAGEGVPVLGTSPDAIDLAEDRGRFGRLLSDLGLLAPRWAVADDPADALAAAEEVGYPLLVRPSYVLGGRAMAICLVAGRPGGDLATRTEPGSGPLLLDRFLEGAVEMDVDALSDGEDCWIAGVMEHVEEAGIHSGDSACVLPPQTVGPGVIAELEDQTAELARALGAVGLLNVQFALAEGRVWVIEANPRASRTVPFVAKATGVPLVRHAVRVMLGARLDDLDLPDARPRATSRSRRRCCPSPGSPAPTRSSAPRCAPPAR